MGWVLKNPITHLGLFNKVCMAHTQPNPLKPNPPISHPSISNASRGPSSHYLAGNFQNQIGTLFLLKDMMIRRTIICRIGMIKT